MINYNSHKNQPFYNRGVRVDQVDKQHCLYIHEATTIFQRLLYKIFTSKFQQTCIKIHLVEIKLYKKRCEVYIHSLELQEYLFAPNIVCGLETNFLNFMSFSVTTKKLFMFQSHFVLCFTWQCSYTSSCMLCFGFNIFKHL